jgi:signal transduction histidine kinase
MTGLLSGLAHLRSGLRALRRQGASGLLIALAVLVPAGALALGRIYGPPTGDSLEKVLWETWSADAAKTEGKETNLLDYLAKDDRQAAQGLLKELGEVFEDSGTKHVVYTRVDVIRLEKARAGGGGFVEKPVFAEWNPKDRDPSPTSLRRCEILMRDPKTDELLGRLVIVYRFWLHSNPIHRWDRVQQFAWWFYLVPVIIGALLFGLGVVLNRNRVKLQARNAQLRVQQQLYEANEERLRAQQMLIQVGERMSHELGNALWAFNNELGNVGALTAKVQAFLEAYPEAFKYGADQLDLAPEQVERMMVAFRRSLERQGLGPERDLAKACREAALGAEPLRRFASYVGLAVERLDRTFRHGRVAGPPEPVAPDAVWANVRATLADRLRSNGVEPREELGAGDSQILAERGSLDQVFFNLAKNALEALQNVSGPRELTFRSRLVGDGVECSIWNSGPPILADILPRLFQQGVTTKGEGRGGGLAQVRDLVQQMRGTIEVASRDGEGTTFLLTLPRYRAESVPEPPAAAT